VLGLINGARKIHAALLREGFTVARCTVERLMRVAGLRGVIRAKSPRTTRPAPETDRPRDLVERQFTATAPNQLWVADITYIRTFSGWVYAAFVMTSSPAWSSAGRSPPASTPTSPWTPWTWPSSARRRPAKKGDGAFPGGTIEVPGHNTWRGTIGFHSPANSGVYNHYEARNDMTIEIIMSGPFGPVRGTITCRTMFRYGVNITRVATEDFTNQEYTDLGTAVNRTRTLYEQRDMTFDVQWRGIARANVGGYEIIDSFDEFHQLLSDWSGPDTDQNIDAFIVQSIAIAGTGVDGIDGSIPGPTSHAGPDSGITASKCGYVDAGGTRRLHAEYLGMLIGHELGRARPGPCR